MKGLESYLLVVVGLSVGVAMATQAGVNATLKTALASPVQAAFISFLVGTVLLGLVALSLGGNWFSAGSAAQLPWWAWIGGGLGAFAITLSIFLAPRLGALLLAVSIITGQVIASMIYDHFGLVGYPKVDLSAKRIIGAALMLLGLVLAASR